MQIFHRTSAAGVRAGRLLCAFAAVSVTVEIASAQWIQFGGPKRDFTVQVGGLADTWPEGGPRQLWRRPLGEGYSSILVDEGRLYTMTHKDGNEYVVCLKADDGETVWEYGYETDGVDRGFGPGPRGTPSIDGDRIYAVGISGRLHCMNKKDGKVQWSHDLVKEFGAEIPRWGYANSPLVYKDLLIVPVGGADKGIAAFRKTTGDIEWMSEGLPNGYASPLPIDVDGQVQIAVFMGKEVVGVNPETGAILWRHGHETNYDVNATMPVWTDDNVLIIASAYGTGAQALRLKRDGDKTTLTPVWKQKSLGVHHGTLIRLGDALLGSVGMMGGAAMVAVDIHTGDVKYRRRNFGKATMIQADGKLIVLDEAGKLGLARATGENFETISSADIFTDTSWTVPTLVGTTLYVRDKHDIAALSLQ